MDLTDQQWADARTDVSGAATSRRARPAVDRSARRLEWRALGPPDRRAVARPAAAVSAVSTCHRRFQQARSGRLDRLLQRLAEDLRDRGEIASHRSVRRCHLRRGDKGRCRCPPAVVKGAKSRRSATAMVFLSPGTWPALRRMSPTSTRHARRALPPRAPDAPDRRPRLRQRRARRASGALRHRDDRAHRRGRRRTQDGRPLRRTKRR